METREHSKRKIEAGALAIELSSYKREYQKRKDFIRDIFSLLFSDPGTEIDEETYPSFRDLAAGLNSFNRGTKSVQDCIDTVRSDLGKLDLLIE